MFLMNHLKRHHRDLFCWNQWEVQFPKIRCDIDFSIPLFVVRENMYVHASTLSWVSGMSCVCFRRRTFPHVGFNWTSDSNVKYATQRNFAVAMHFVTFHKSKVQTALTTLAIFPHYCERSASLSRGNNLEKIDFIISTACIKHSQT